MRKSGLFLMCGAIVALAAIASASAPAVASEKDGVMAPASVVLAFGPPSAVLEYDVTSTYVQADAASTTDSDFSFATAAMRIVTDSADRCVRSPFAAERIESIVRDVLPTVEGVPKST